VAEAVLDAVNYLYDGDLLAVFRTSPSMISDEGKGKKYVEEQAQGSGDDRGRKLVADLSLGQTGVAPSVIRKTVKSLKAAVQKCQRAEKKF
jgi:hypothetical protein